MPPWNQVSLPGDAWNTAPVPDHSTVMQASGSDWSSHGHAVTAQDLQALEASSWLNVPHGSVDMGLSPVLSQESQSTHTLNTISEPEVPLLPPGLDLSFISEPSWDVSGPVVYSSSHVPQDCSPSFVASSVQTPCGHSLGQFPGYGVPQSAACGPHQPMYPFQGGQVPCPRRSASDPALAQRRPLLPRTDAQGQYAVHQPQIAAGRPGSTASVSTSQGQMQETVMPASLSRQSSGSVATYSRMSPPARTVLSPRLETAPQAKGPATSMVESAAEDFSSFIRYDQDDKLAPGPMSYGPSTYVSAPSQVGPTRDVKAHSESGPPQASSTASSEMDEGRHRTHHLYNEGPKADGLYHCPFKTDPSCGHKPTKLKCNYDKFIDSHLKPFRCKVEACSKQEFSSTACLLRHEREAHGMHGHGDRPHLCFYPGCERGIPGNGFPRRYNLFDHMKRVHDHQDERSQSFRAPESRGKAAGRKRKAGAASHEAAAQRQKVQHVQQPTPSRTMSPGGFAQQAPMFQEPRHDPLRQRQIYSQWNNQPELLEFQQNSLRPDDEASFQYFSQNVDDLRHLSHEARQG
ncbi:Hypothetical predicted protein [Lecanosticta acicola]|uniref:C2H2-type domain-containing protein n=1 Tax=Lecanosticta acicola TaxID=111012 RepID=A0AAI8Z4W8_9PEZI|nr:Hypothetical predicted protein [Lecanosticta acicola]